MVTRILAGSLIWAFSLCLWAEESDAFKWENTLTLESITNLKGGLDTGTRNLGNLDVTLNIDTRAAGWWDGGNLFVYVLGDYGRPPSALTGELQVLSNIEATDNLLLYEFWYEHSFAEGAVKILVGLHDYNSTFYALESASLFNLSSMGVGPEVAQVTPSIFPVTAPGVHLTLNHHDTYFLLAVYDGVPGDPAHTHGTHIKFSRDDGLFTASELGIFAEHQFKIGLGAWRHTARVENPVDGTLSQSNSGFYLIGEKYWTENFAAFIQYGKADKHKNQLGSYIGGGFTFKNWMREGDEVGLAFAKAKNSEDFLLANPDFYSAETTSEISYFWPVTEKVSFQTSVYRVAHPSMAPDVENSLAVGLRLYVGL
ncbi:carbohydrate porin [Cellvibrio sp.]|uniref:carbohydrate porin n=1 Tax=Cellvibrio sp. TaxID=1965322 RepID=UPI0039647A53